MFFYTSESSKVSFNFFFFFFLFGVSIVFSRGESLTGGNFIPFLFIWISGSLIKKDDVDGPTLSENPFWPLDECTFLNSLSISFPSSLTSFKSFRIGWLLIGISLPTVLLLVPESASSMPVTLAFFFLNFFLQNKTKKLKPMFVNIKSNKFSRDQLLRSLKHLLPIFYRESIHCITYVRFICSTDKQWVMNINKVEDYVE